MSVLAPLLAFLNANPQFYPLVVWPLLTALLSFFQDAMSRRWPTLTDRLMHSGLDLKSFLQTWMTRKGLPPMPGEKL